MTGSSSLGRRWCRAGLHTRSRRAGGASSYALVEPLGPRGAELTRSAQDLCGRDIADLIPIGSEPRADPTSLVAYTDRLVAALTPQPTDRALSPHVIAALEYLDGALQQRPRLDEAARAAHISPSRLTHLFSDQVGIPFRRFVVWLRLQRAAEFAWSAQTLTEAAITAGFSDMAHFSRVCRSTFGVSPSALLQMKPILAPWPV